MAGFTGPSQSQVDSCVSCGLCLPHCPTFRLTGDEAASPRGRIVAMGAVGSGRAPSDETFAKMMSFCLQCRACEAACPSLVPFGEMMEGARAQLVIDQPSRNSRVRTLLVGRLLNYKWLMALVTSAIGLLQRFGLWRLLPHRLRPARGLRRQLHSGKHAVPRLFWANARHARPRCRGHFGDRLGCRSSERE